MLECTEVTLAMGVVIGGDFLLAYKLDDGSKPGLIVFVRVGTHADLFE